MAAGRDARCRCATRWGPPGTSPTRRCSWPRRGRLHLRRGAAGRRRRAGRHQLSSVRRGGHDDGAFTGYSGASAFLWFRGHVEGRGRGNAVRSVVSKWYRHRQRRIGRLAGIVAAGLAVAGCASAGNPVTLFADPGKYQFHSCEQIARQRKHWAGREQELRLLMDKACRAPAGRWSTCSPTRPTTSPPARSSRCSKRPRAPRTATRPLTWAAAPRSGSRARCRFRTRQHKALREPGSHAR